MSKHNCRNPKFCPICRQKVKNKIIKIFKNNPKTNFSYNQIKEEIKMSSMPYETLRSIMKKLELDGIVIRKYIFTKRLTIGSGVRTHFSLYQTNLDLMRFNSKYE